MLKSLLEKEIVSLEELQQIEEAEEITSLENNGCSGRYAGKTWYTATTADGKEYDLYTA